MIIDRTREQVRRSLRNCQKSAQEIKALICLMGYQIKIKIATPSYHKRGNKKVSAKWAVYDVRLVSRSTFIGWDMQVIHIHLQGVNIKQLLNILYNKVANGDLDEDYN